VATKVVLVVVVVVVVGSADEDVVTWVVSVDGEVIFPESLPQATNARLAVTAKRTLGRQSTSSMVSALRG